MTNKTITIYGIRNCDTMKKAFTWLDGHGVSYDFHDYKKEGVDRAKLESWCQALGWETVLNRAGAPGQISMAELEKVLGQRPDMVVPFLPKQFADAALLVSAEDVDSIASGIGRVVADEPLRARLRAAGPERARRFTWGQAAKHVLACYERVSR